MRKFLALSLLMAVSVLGTTFATPVFAGYEVIVNKGNPISEIGKKELKRIYKMKTTIWDAGGNIQPVNLWENNAVREEFSQSVLGKSPKAMEAFYLKRALSGNGQPPKSFVTEQDIINFVSSNAGAIGYVSKSSGSVKTIPVK